MKPLAKIKQTMKGMNRRQKAEIVIASALTVVFFTGLPVFAWFSNSKNLKTITKVKAPGEIIIRAGKSAPENEDADLIVNFEMKDIDIEAIAKGTPGRYVFSVKPGDYRKYDLILAHTTNIPFTYTLYHAQAVDESGMSEEQIEALGDDKSLTLYTPRADNTLKTYYRKNGEAIPMTIENPDDSSYGRELAKKNDVYYNLTYDSAKNDAPQIYAVPIYAVTTDPIWRPENAVDSYDYFILELNWDTTANTSEGFAYADWNKAKNIKETDMIYITAYKSLD